MVWQKQQFISFAKALLLHQVAYQKVPALFAFFRKQVLSHTHWHLLFRAVVQPGVCEPPGVHRRFPGVLGWQLSFHILLFFNILY